MEMKLSKRDFIKLGGSMFILPTLPQTIFKAFNNTRRSLRGQTKYGYPGTIKPLNHSKMKSKGDWAG
jgi:hypothetical protein